MRHFPIITFLISLAACASATTSPRYEKELEAWVGKPVDSLVSAWGVPEGSFKRTDGGTVLTWKRSGIAMDSGTQRVTPALGGGSTISGGPRAYSKFCTTSFTANRAGIISDWSYEGNGC